MDIIYLHILNTNIKSISEFFWSGNSIFLSGEKTKYLHWDEKRVVADNEVLLKVCCDDKEHIVSKTELTCFAQPIVVDWWKPARF